MAIWKEMRDALKEVVREGPELEAAVAEFIGSAQHWDDLQAEIEGRKRTWGMRDGEAVFEWGPAGEVKPRHPTVPRLKKFKSASERKGVPVPPAMLDYIQGRLNGTIKVPRGNRNKEKSPLAAHFRTRLAWRVDEVRKLCDADPAYRTEIERTSGHTLSKGSLDRALRQVESEERYGAESLRTYHKKWRKRPESR